MDDNIKKYNLYWRESGVHVSFDCTVSVAEHLGSTKEALLIIPGIDGDIDGFQSKYLDIASNVRNDYGFTVFRMDNPYISHLHWESNIREVLKHILQENNIERLFIMAHSAGAWIISRIAWEYPEIEKLLLINPAVNIPNIDDYANLAKSGSKNTFLIGEKDRSVQYSDHFNALDNSAVSVVAGADHHFSGEAFTIFMNSPHEYLFSSQK